MKKIVLSLSLGLIMAGAELHAWRCYNQSGQDVTVYFYGADGIVITQNAPNLDGGWPCAFKGSSYWTGSWTGIGSGTPASYVGVKSKAWLTPETGLPLRNSDGSSFPTDNGGIDIMPSGEIVITKSDSGAGVIMAVSSLLTVFDLAAWLLYYNFGKNPTDRIGCCDFLANGLFGPSNSPDVLALLRASLPVIDTHFLGISTNASPDLKALTVAKDIITAVCQGVSIPQRRCGDNSNCKPTCKGASGYLPNSISCINGVCDENGGWGYFFVDSAGNCI